MTAVQVVWAVAGWFTLNMLLLLISAVSVRHKPRHAARRTPLNTKGRL